VSDSGIWMQTAFIDAGVSRNPCRYSVPRDMGEAHSNISPGIAVSVEEKVSDLIQSYPHLEPFLKSHSQDGNARIRDLAISSKERDQLLFQIIAARRQQLLTAGTARPASQAAHGPRLRTRPHTPRRRKPPQAWLMGFSTPTRAGAVTEKLHKRFWG